MNSYYVDVIEGDDREHGRCPYLPWKTIAKVNSSALNAGDSVSFKRGREWREQLTPPASGTKGDHILFGAYGVGADPSINASDIITGWALYGCTTWQATVTTKCLQTFMDNTRLTEGVDRDSLNDHEWVWAANVLYVRDDTGDPDITGVVIEAGQRERCIHGHDLSFLTFQHLRMSKANRHAFSAWNVAAEHELHFENCEMSWNVLSGAYYSGIVNARFNNCEFHHQLKEHGLYIGGDKGTNEGAIIEDCHMHHNGAYGLQMQPDAGPGGNRIANPVFRRCVFDANYGPGIVDLCSKDALYENCLVYGNCTGSGVIAEAYFSARPDNPTKGVLNATISHCTIVGANPSLRFQDDTAGFMVRNCILMITDGSQPLIEVQDDVATFDIDNCLYYVAGGYDDRWLRNGVHYDSLSEWRAATGGDVNSDTGDPDFKDEPGGDSHIGVNSEAINAGVNVGVNADYDGMIRGDPPDVGAYEYVE